MIAAVSVLAALALDACLGEPRRFHPLAAFGRLAQACERRMYADARVRGAVAVLMLLLPFTVLAVLARWLPWAAVIDVLLLYLAVGWRSLEEHARRVADAMKAGDLAAARQHVSLMVSRDAAVLDRQGVAKATVESVLENGNDAIFGALFWFVVAGGPGVVLYRLANTLDAMWGYRSERYRNFGWAAARLDDVLNFVPARLTALSYAMAGRFSLAVRCWRIQGRAWKSPNAGPVMAAGAGSLGVLLGGAASYHGSTQTRPPLGDGRSPEMDDIDQALRLIRRALLLWVLFLCVGESFVEYAARH